MEIFRTLRLQVCIIFSKSAPRLPVFDRMSADSFDQLINKAMSHFLSPFLSSLQRAKIDEALLVGSTRSLRSCHMRC